VTHDADQIQRLAHARLQLADAASLRPESAAA
jgi:hypothetical protein